MGGVDCDRDRCLIPSAADVGVNEATELMAAVDPSTTTTIDGTTLRCAIPCAALHDVFMGTQKKPPGQDDSIEPKCPQRIGAIKMPCWSLLSPLYKPTFSTSRSLVLVWKRPGGAARSIVFLRVSKPSGFYVSRDHPAYTITCFYVSRSHPAYRIMCFHVSRSHPAYRLTCLFRGLGCRLVRNIRVFTCPETIRF